MKPIFCRDSVLNHNLMEAVCVTFQQPNRNEQIQVMMKNAGLHLIDFISKLHLVKVDNIYRKMTIV